MIDEKIANELNLQLQRIFCLPITRSTFRELQNVMMALAEGNEKKAQSFFETLLSGQIKEGSVSNEAMTKVQALIQRFTIPARMSKEVFEKGEFIAGITSETVTKGESGENALIMSRIRRVDGQEMEFVNSPQTLLNCMHHFLQRLEELEKLDKGREALIQNRELIENLKERLSQMTGALV